MHLLANQKTDSHAFPNTQNINFELYFIVKAQACTCSILKIETQGCPNTVTTAYISQMARHRRICACKNAPLEKTISG
jgi:hypothetical protein